MTLVSISVYAPQAEAGEFVMPAPGTIVHLSPAYTPAHLMGMTIHPDNALKFDFLIHQGNENLSQEQKKQEYTKLVKYFLASLTIPDKDQWVNLSPYEHNRIIADNFGKTEMGRDLLAQDYLLKQITSSLMYPESGLGKSFWDQVYSKAWQEFHTTNIPVNTFNKVWIVPDQAVVYEKGNTAYIIQSHLKVMLEEDYLSLSKHLSNKTHSIGSQVIREIILPALEKEVNEGKNFSQLRQIVSGMILATWYKKALKESLLGKIYADKAKVKGVDTRSSSQSLNIEYIYQQYLKAFKKGVFNYIKEDVAPMSPAPQSKEQGILPRKYFAGGFDRALTSERIVDELSPDLIDAAQLAWGKTSVDRAMIQLEEPGIQDQAMIQVPQEILTKISKLGRDIKFLRRGMLREDLVVDVQTFVRTALSQRTGNAETVIANFSKYVDEWFLKRYGFPIFGKDYEEGWSKDNSGRLVWRGLVVFNRHESGQYLLEVNQDVPVFSYVDQLVKFIDERFSFNNHPENSNGVREIYEQAVQVVPALQGDYGVKFESGLREFIESKARDVKRNVNPISARERILIKDTAKYIYEEISRQFPHTYILDKPTIDPYPDYFRPLAQGVYGWGNAAIVRYNEEKEDFEYQDNEGRAYVQQLISHVARLYGLDLGPDHAMLAPKRVRYFSATGYDRNNWLVDLMDLEEFRAATGIDIRRNSVTFFDIGVSTGESVEGLWAKLYGPDYPHTTLIATELPTGISKAYMHSSLFLNDDILEEISMRYAIDVADIKDIMLVVDDKYEIHEAVYKQGNGQLKQIGISDETELYGYGKKVNRGADILNKLKALLPSEYLNPDFLKREIDHAADDEIKFDEHVSLSLNPLHKRLDNIEVELQVTDFPDLRQLPKDQRAILLFSHVLGHYTEEAERMFLEEHQNKMREGDVLIVTDNAPADKLQYTRVYQMRNSQMVKIGGLRSTFSLLKVDSQGALHLSFDREDLYSKLNSNVITRLIAHPEIRSAINFSREIRRILQAQLSQLGRTDREAVLAGIEKVQELLQSRLNKTMPPYTEEEIDGLLKDQAMAGHGTTDAAMLDDGLARRITKYFDDENVTQQQREILLEDLFNLGSVVLGPGQADLSYDDLKVKPGVDMQLRWRFLKQVLEILKKFSSEGLGCWFIFQGDDIKGVRIYVRAGMNQNVKQGYLQAYLDYLRAVAHEFQTGMFDYHSVKSDIVKILRALNSSQQIELMSDLFDWTRSPLMRVRYGVRYDFQQPYDATGWKWRALMSIAENLENSSYGGLTFEDRYIGSNSRYIAIGVDPARFNDRSAMQGYWQAYLDNLDTVLTAIILETSMRQKVVQYTARTFQDVHAKVFPEIDREKKVIAECLGRLTAVLGINMPQANGASQFSIYTGNEAVNFVLNRHLAIVLDFLLISGSRDFLSDGFYIKAPSDHHERIEFGFKPTPNGVNINERNVLRWISALKEYITDIKDAIGQLPDRAMTVTTHEIESVKDPLAEKWKKQNPTLKFPVGKESTAGTDAAMNGGIDLNSAHLNLQIRRDGNGVPLPLSQQDMAQLIRVQGFEPKILEIKPAVDLPIISELQQKMKSLSAV